LERKGCQFDGETDTEVVAVLTKHLYTAHQGKINFRRLVELVCLHLVKYLHITYLVYFINICVISYVYNLINIVSLRQYYLVK
jgi:glucosamine 6-phosphate synthetase-like amidotransferase/phosphosugar isomerase protein